MSVNSKRNKSGRLLIDHTAVFGPNFKVPSIPGLPDNPVVESGQKWEGDTTECGHCGTTIIFNDRRTTPWNYCSKGDHYLCENPRCHAAVCIPYHERMALRLEKEAQLAKQTIDQVLEAEFRNRRLLENA